MRSLLLMMLVAADTAPAPPPRTVRDGLVEMEVQDVFAVGDGQSWVVLLSPRGESVVVPIFIGPAEATAIQLRLGRRRPPRPLTHDLLETMIRTLGGRVTRVVIDDLKDDIFLGRISLEQNGKTQEVDARPSDSIALALGTEAPILAARKVIRKSGVRRTELDSKLSKTPEGPERTPSRERETL